MMERKLSRSDSKPTREPSETFVEHEPISVPYIVHEGIMARFERIIKRLWVTITILVVLLVGTNIAWLIYESQFQVVQTYDVEQNTEGGDNNDMRGIELNGKTTCDDGKDKG